MKKNDAKKPGYAGRIDNSGAQVVQAPFAPKPRTGDTKITGKDLRTGK